MPLRVKSMIIVNAPWYMRWMIKIYKMFASEKMARRIHVCYDAPDGQYNFTPEAVANGKQKFNAYIKELYDIPE